MHLIEALRTADTARSSYTRDEAMDAALAAVERAIECCYRLGWTDLAHDLQATKAKLAKRRRNATRQ